MEEEFINDEDNDDETEIPCPFCSGELQAIYSKKGVRLMCLDPYCPVHFSTGVFDSLELAEEAIIKGGKSASQK